MNTHPNPPEGREFCPAIGFMKGYDCTLVGIELNVVIPYNHQKGESAACLVGIEINIVVSYNKLYKEAFLNCFDA